ncbi:MAG TPA: thioredoxin domain-containing protein [Nitrososphaeraceae archaeon]|nr:thioredoxin domain-containing protein [Nitrososphaeraceae archaeon]
MEYSAVHFNLIKKGSKYHIHLYGFVDDIQNSQNKPNNLIKETSPYLLQHAYNPVQWYSWNEEALERSKNEDKPIFLSVGYSSCHWCHVMAHESFEDNDIAKIMNEHYINIKVDREERPDIDDIYQRACQMYTGTGGWPLSAFLTPDQRPFYIGTYFPKESRHGLPGFGTILLSLADGYKNRRNEVDSSSQEFVTALRESSMDIVADAETKLEKTTINEAAVTLLQLADNLYGGFGSAPKFPNASNLLFLLRAYDYSGITKYRDFVNFTADKMDSGGIHDHVGGGFARYSTDQRWLVPHFEKMLYDNALLAMLYSELFSITSIPNYSSVLEKILRYVQREMTSNDGAFYSSQDADSEGEEGKYYLWSYKELQGILDHEIFEIFTDRFGVTQGGNFEGRNILNKYTSIQRLAERYSKNQEWISEKLESSLEQLYELRLKRIKPGTDRKILTSWNGLMISGFVSGYKVTGKLSYLQSAQNAVSFIENNLRNNENRLNRVFNKVSKISGYLDDYAFYVDALINLFSIDSKSYYLERAIDYTDSMITHFWDPKSNDFYFTPDDNEKLIVRTKNHYDLAIPSGNSVAASNLIKLYYYTQNDDYLTKADQLIKRMVKPAIGNPFGFGQLLSAVYLRMKTPLEISIIKHGENSELAAHLNKKFLPNAITAIVNKAELSELDKYSYFKNKSINNNTKNDNKEYAFVCKDFTCSLPLSTIEELDRNILKEKVV